MRIDKDLQELHHAYDKCEMRKVYQFGALSRKYGVCVCGRVFVYFGQIILDHQLRMPSEMSRMREYTKAWKHVPRVLAARQIRAERRLIRDMKKHQVKG